MYSRAHAYRPLKSMFENVEVHRSQRAPVAKCEPRLRARWKFTEFALSMLVKVWSSRYSSPAGIVQSLVVPVAGTSDSLGYPTILKSVPLAFERSPSYTYLRGLNREDFKREAHLAGNRASPRSW